MRFKGVAPRTAHGQRLDIVQRVVGQTEPRSTQLYADVTEDDVRWALETRR